MTAPVTTPPVVGVSKTASRWRMSVDTGWNPTDPGAANWVEVYGISNLTPGTVTRDSVDDTDYDGVDPNTGFVWKSNTIIGGSWELSGTHTTKTYSGSRDPGAAFLEDQGDLNIPVHVRWYDLVSSKAFEGYGDVQWQNAGGAASDLSSATFTIAGKGPRTAITNPKASAAVPNGVSASPTTGPIGTVVTVTGTNFTGATSVKFGTTNAGLYTVVSDTQIKATVPTGITTGSQPIAVANAVGPDATPIAFTVS